MKEWYVSMRISAKASDARRKFLPRKRSHEEKDRGAGSDDPVHQYRFPQMVNCAVEEAKKNPFRYAAVTQAALQLSRTF